MTLIIPEPLGSFLSYIIKSACIILMTVVTVSVYNKYKKKQSLILRNITLMFLSYTIVPVLALFNTAFNLRDFPYEDSYMILYLGFIFVAIGNCFYYWFIIDVFYRVNRPEISYNKYSIPVVVTHLSCAVLAFILRFTSLFQLSLFLIFIHIMISTGIYIILLYNAVNSLRAYNIPSLKRRFRNIAESAICGAITIFLIVIDSFYGELTLFNLLSWLTFTLNAVFCFYAFIGHKGDGLIAITEENRNR